MGEQPVTVHLIPIITINPGFGGYQLFEPGRKILVYQEPNKVKEKVKGRSKKCEKKGS